MLLGLRLVSSSGRAERGEGDAKLAAGVVVVASLGVVIGARRGAEGDMGVERRCVCMA